MFRDRVEAVQALNGGWYLPQVLESGQEWPSFALRNMTVQKSSDPIIFLDSLSTVGSSGKDKDCRIPLVSSTGTVVGLCQQLVCEALRLLFESSGSHRFSNATVLCMWYNVFQSHLFLKFTPSYYQSASMESCPCSKRSH